MTASLLLGLLLNGNAVADDEHEIEKMFSYDELLSLGFVLTDDASS